MNIKTVSLLKNGGYLINEVLSVPEDPANRHYRAVQLWLADNEPILYAAPVPSPRQVRDEALAALVHDFGDGRVIQTRPKDEPNFERAYRIFALTQAPTIDWVMANNVKHPVTEAGLREAHDAGILAGAVIWDAYDPEA